MSEEGLDITGGLFPGTPVILHGFNRHLGWANTVSKPDLTDIYRLTINPDNANMEPAAGLLGKGNQITARAPDRG